MPLRSSSSLRRTPVFDRLAATITVAAIVSLTTVLTGVPVASAAEDASISVAPEPSSSAESTESSTSPPTSIAPADQPPTVTVDPPGDITALPFALTGSRTPGSEVQVQLTTGGGDPLCISPAEESSSWSCEVAALPDGADIGLRVVALATSGNSEQQVSVAWLNPPTIIAPAHATTAGQVGGSAYPGATVNATVVASPSECTATAAKDGSWTCILSEPLPTGEYHASAHQSASFFPRGSAQSPFVAVIVDKDAPSSPTITSPAAGSEVVSPGATFSGTGDDGNTVLLFAGIRPLCQTPVDGTRWSCTVTASVPDGEASVTAVQLDPAGNASAASAALEIIFSAIPTATPSPGPSFTSPQHENAEPLRLPAPPLEQPTSEDPLSAGAAPPQAVDTPRWMRELSAPTAIGSSLAPLTAVASGQLVTALALSGSAFLMLLLPGLLASRSLAGRLGRVPSFTGRNRARADDRFARIALDPRFVAVASLLAAAIIAILAHPVLAQANYARLALAVGLALATVNLLGTAAVVMVARRFFDIDVTVGTRARLLGVAAVTAIVTRAFGLAPPLAYGQVLGIDHGATTSRRQRSAVALAQTGVLVTLALAAWLAYGDGPTSFVFANQFAGEYTSTVTFAAAGAAAIGMLPARSLPGGAILQHSRWIWALATVTSWTALFLVLTAVTESGTVTGLVAGAFASAAFAILSLAAWAWIRWVEPVFAQAE